MWLSRSQTTNVIIQNGNLLKSGKSNHYFNYTFKTSLTVYLVHIELAYTYMLNNFRQE